MSACLAGTKVPAFGQVYARPAAPLQPVAPIARFRAALNHLGMGSAYSLNVNNLIVGRSDRGLSPRLSVPRLQQIGVYKWQ